MNSYLMYVGARTTPERGTGVGISCLTGPLEASAAWHHLGVTPSVNPGALVVGASGRILHAAHGDGETVSSYRILTDGTLEHLVEQRTGGTNPAHICLSPRHRFLLVANHTSGSIASLPIETTGAVGPMRSLLTFSGPVGPHRIDQAGPKPHQVAFNPSGEYLFVPDKGLDTVFVCALDEETGDLAQVTSTRLREGSGPRHIAFHPAHPVAYVVNELDSTIAVLDLSPLPDQPPRPVQVLTTLDPDDPRDSRAAAIVVSPDGSAVYASNRSGAGDRTPGGPQDDSIAVFSTRSDGRLDITGHFSSRGIRPRFMTLTPDGKSLVVANEKSGSLWEFGLPSAGGLPTEGHQLADVTSPVSTTFARVH